MSNDDSMLFTGVDKEPKGMFENEVEDEEVKKKLDDQDRILKEITPRIKDLLKVIDEEIKSVNSISELEEADRATCIPENDIRSELKARKRYIVYLNNLRVKFTLALQEVKKNG